MEPGVWTTQRVTSVYLLAAVLKSTKQKVLDYRGGNRLRIFPTFVFRNRPSVTFRASSTNSFALAWSPRVAKPKANIRSTYGRFARRCSFFCTAAESSIHLRTMP